MRERTWAGNELKGARNKRRNKRRVWAAAQGRPFPAVVKAAEHELARSALEIVLCDSDNDVEVEKRRIETLLRRRVDALLICPVHVTDSAAAITAIPRTTSVLQLDRLILPDPDFVGVDHASGMDQIVRHVVDVGASSAVLLGVTDGLPTIEERAEGTHGGSHAG